MYWKATKYCPMQVVLFFQIKYLFIFYTLLREFYKCLLVQKYKDYMDVE